MTIKFSPLFGVLIGLLTHQCAHAQQTPQTFGSQRGATGPICSWKGTYLVVNNEETNAFQLWNIATKRRLWRSDDYFLSFSRDEKTIMVAQSAIPLDGEIHDLDGVSLRLLDARTGRLLRRMAALRLPRRSTTDELLDYGFSVDGSQFLLATQNYLRVYNTRSGALSTTKKWSGLKTTIPLTCAVFSSDKKQLVAFDGDIVVLDVRSGALIRRIPQMSRSATLNDVWQDGPDFLDVSPDSSLLVENFSDDTDSRIYRLGDGKLLWSTPIWPTFSIDGKLVYVPLETGLDVLEPRTGHKLKTLSGPTEYGFDVSPDNNWIYETRDDKIYRWRAR